MNLTQHIANEINKNKTHIPLSGVTSYHLLSGSLALVNSVVDTGMATTLYTGNGTTQSVVTGVDMTTQWGNLATEKFGGLVWGKSRSAILNNFFIDTVRGVTKEINSNTTEAEETLANSLTAFNNNGFSLGSDVGLNTNLATYASWNFQTTHRITGTTNHGKAYTCHYNPFTGFTIVKYEGSGLAGHEIPHHLGRKLGFVTTKTLGAINDWCVQFKESHYNYLNTTAAEVANTQNITNFGNDVTTLGTSSNANLSAGQMIMYGWANSYFDEANTLIGNYEVGVYQGTGVAGNKVTTRGKPAWVMIKNLTSTGSWTVIDNLRSDNYVYANSSQAEVNYNHIDIVSDGFIVQAVADAQVNTAGAQHLYMVVYDNDTGSGKSKYPRATDTSNLSLNATVPFANGLDVNGAKNTILAKNETVSGLTLTQGKNYLWCDNTGAYGVTPYRPRYVDGDLIAERDGDVPNYYDVKNNQWYSTVANSELVTNGTFDTNVSGWTVTAGSFVFSSGTGRLNNGSSTVNTITQTITTEVGKAYKFKASYQVTVGWLQILAGGVQIHAGTLTGSATVEYQFIAQSTSTVISFTTDNTAGTNVYIDNVSVYKKDLALSTPIANSRNYLDAIVYADNNGQPTYVEQLPKTEYKDIIKANEYQGKNACTAWVNFDGTTTPPTIRDRFNVKAVIRTATGNFDIYFDKPMDNVNYTPVYGVRTDGSGTWVHITSNTVAPSLQKISTLIGNGTSLVNSTMATLQIFGGKN
jgi:hypothetical protein